MVGLAVLPRLARGVGRAVDDRDAGLRHVHQPGLLDQRRDARQVRERALPRGEVEHGQHGVRLAAAERRLQLDDRLAALALTIVDAVTSLGGMPLDVGAWGIDAAYSCTQKCLGGPSGLAPVVFGPRALEQKVKCRSFYFDLGLLEDYWLRRKYHHTMSSALVYALYESLAIVEEEGLDARWSRHQKNHQTLVAALTEMGLSLLPPESDRLWTLNAVRVPDGVDEAAVRTHLLDQFNIEIGAGLGPLAGKIWRVGLMGASSSPRLIVLLRGALDSALAKQGHRVHA